MTLFLFLALAHVALCFFAAGYYYAKSYPFKDKTEHVNVIFGTLALCIAYLEILLVGTAWMLLCEIGQYFHVQELWRLYILRAYNNTAKISRNRLGRHRQSLKQLKRGNLSDRIFAHIVIVLLRKMKDEVILGDKVIVKQKSLEGGIYTVVGIQKENDRLMVYLEDIFSGVPLENVAKFKKTKKHN